MTAHVRFEGVSVRYGSRAAVQDVSATVDSGSFTAIIGPNGSGKSTLLNLLTGHHAAHSGRILVRGRSITDLKGRERAAEIGALRQDTGPLPDVTVAELVALGPRILDRGTVDAALERVGLTRLADQPVLALSGGQLQRALLARAIRHQPRLLVLDEPTNHLDVQHRIAILSMVRDLGITVISALHDLDLTRQYADHVIVLSEGRLHAHGAPPHAMSRAVLRDVFHVDAHSVTTSAGAQHLVFSSLPPDPPRTDGSLTAHPGTLLG